VLETQWCPKGGAEIRLFTLRQSKSLRPCGVHLAKLIQLHHQPVPQGTFGPQLLEQRFCFIECFRAHSALHHACKGSLNFGFGKQWVLPRSCEWQRTWIVRLPPFYWKGRYSQ
jgi:hypothetical protein